MGAKRLVKVNKGKAVIRLINPNEKKKSPKRYKVLAVVSQEEKTNVFAQNDSDVMSKTATNVKDGETSPKFSFD